LLVIYDNISVHPPVTVEWDELQFQPVAAAAAGPGCIVHTTEPVPAHHPHPARPLPGLTGKPAPIYS